MTKSTVIFGTNAAGDTLHPVEVSNSGALQVDVLSGGGAGTQYSVGTTGMASGTGTLLIASNGGTAREVGATALGELTVSDQTSQGSLSSIDGKVTACDTGSVTVASSVLPTGAATEASLSSVDGKIIACNTGAVTVASSALPTGAATEASLSSVDGKITACDTGSVTVASSALPTGAATESSLASVDGKLSNGNNATISTGLEVVAFGRDQAGNLDALNVDGQGHLLIVKDAVGDSSITATQTITPGAGNPAISSSEDMNGFSALTFFGSSTNSSDTITLQLSNDNTNWFEASEYFINTNMVGGNVEFSVDIANSAARYWRIRQEDTIVAAYTLTVNAARKVT
jgi:hypothetical protein